MFAPTTVSHNFVIIHTHKPKFVNRTNIYEQIKLKKKSKKANPIGLAFNWRRHPDLNWGIRVLQTRALPLGYDAILTFNTKSTKGLRFSAF